MSDRTEPTKCETCGGWGWNQSIKHHPVDISAPVRSVRRLRTLMEYMRERLCCPDCGGSGKRRIVTNEQ